MAEKKTTKKATAKKADAKAKSLDELRTDLQLARKSHAAGELVNPRVLKSYRKDIARELTKQNMNKGEEK
ncbi:50S ribosomal protein L29 [Candidatus Nomurabacteria bacterium]|nr:50S ribosomal protein L29 [Candidatus Nomurabacteria bacterium]